MSTKFTGRSAKTTRGQSAKAANFTWALLAILLAVLTAGFTAGCVGNVNGQAPSSVQQLALRFAPASLNFGTVVTGKKTSQNASVTNTGNSPAVISQIVSNNNQITISGVTFPLTLAAGQTANFVVWFNGAAPGKTAATLSFQAGEAGAAAVQINVSANAATPQPQLVVNPAVLDAGSATVGSKTASSITLSNAGTADLTISMISIKGAQFSVSGVATPLVISAGQSAAMTVVYAPTAAQSDSGSISITSNDPASPTSIALGGTGTSVPVGHLTLNPATLAFGNVNVGNNSVLTSTVTNTGQGPVRISQVFASGANFSLSNFATPTTLAAGQSAQIQVKFAPTTTSVAGGTVAITTDAPGAAPGLSLSGTGVQPGISVAPPSISFGSLVDGQAKSQTVTVTNTGTASLTISQLSSTGAGVSVTGVTTPLTIAAGQNSTFNVQFAPIAAGNTSGIVSLTTNASNSPSTVAVSGTGVATTTTLSASPSAVVFGNVNIGSSANQNITITNNGNSTTTITQVGVNGQHVIASGFSTPLALAPSQSVTLNVQYSPAAANSLNGSISIVSAQGQTTMVTVTGSGAQATLAVSPGSVSFSNVVTGSTNSQSVQISNAGNASLTITQANISGSGFSTTGLSLPLALAAGQSSSFNLQFIAQSAGTVGGTLSLVSNAANSTASVALSGSSIASTKTLQVSASSLNFGSVTAGSSSSKTIVLTNTGNADVTISQIGVSGTNFALTGAGAVTLSSGQSDSFGVQYSPTGTETDNGSVSIVSNASGSPAAISLSGTGTAQQVQHNVQLSWADSDSSVAGYNVYRTTTSGSGYVLVNGSLVGSDAFVDSSVQSSTTYYYVTTAVDGSGTESAYSNEAQAIVP
jgi:hypothetical protein